MGTAKATKAADKSQICRKLVTALQKLYGKSVPKIELSVVETMLFAACLEDNPWTPAEAGLKKVLTSYFDLNEVRVSSVSELEQSLAPLKDADWKGLRIRSILRFVFETTYSYDYEKLRRQTLEQAVKTLKKVNDITPFIRDFILHEILGSHIICLDTSMLTAARWLGLVPAKADLHDASEFLKGGIKKSEVSEFCHLLRCLATDPKYAPRFLDPPDTELSMDDVMDRFVELQSPPKKKPAKPIPPPEPPKIEKAAPSKKPAAAPVPEKAAPTKPVTPSGSSKPTSTIPSGPSKTQPLKPAVKQPAPPVKVSAKKTPATNPTPAKPGTSKTVAKQTGKTVSGTSSKGTSAKPAAGKSTNTRKPAAVSGKPTPKKPRK
jgi:endonuclease III